MLENRRRGRGRLHVFRDPLPYPTSEQTISRRMLSEAASVYELHKRNTQSQEDAMTQFLFGLPLFLLGMFLGAWLLWLIQGPGRRAKRTSAVKLTLSSDRRARSRVRIAAALDRQITDAIDEDFDPSEPATKRR